jgi:hypothetical protein
MYYGINENLSYFLYISKEVLEFLFIYKCEMYNIKDVWVFNLI